MFGHQVHATVLQDGWSGMTGAAAQPTRIADGDVPVSADGSITLPVTDGSQGDGAGGNASSCHATGPRVPGKIGNALALCGNNEYVDVPSGIMQGVSDFTISAWVNPSANTAWSRVFDFGTGTGGYMFLTLNAGGGPIRFAITAGEGLVASSRSTAPASCRPTPGRTWLSRSPAAPGRCTSTARRSARTRA